MPDNIILSKPAYYMAQETININTIFFGLFCWAGLFWAPNREIGVFVGALTALVLLYNLYKANKVFAKDRQNAILHSDSRWLEFNIIASCSALILTCLCLLFISVWGIPLCIALLSYTVIRCIILFKTLQVYR